MLITATAFQAVLNPVTGLATDRFGPTRLIPVGLIAMAATLAVFTLPHTPPAQFVVVLLSLCSCTLVWGPAVTLMSSASRAAGLQQGAVFAVVNLAWAIGTLSGSAGSGIISSAHHQTGATVGLSGLTVSTAAITAGVMFGKRVNRPAMTTVRTESVQVSQSR
jgi:predicted MFS family arabinose efflux permease